MRIFVHRTLTILFFVLLVSPSTVLADTASDLQVKIDAKNAEIANIEKDIASYQTQITAAGKQADTLQGALATLQLTGKKLASDLALTQNKIDAVTLTIQSLGDQIADKQTSISVEMSGLSKSISDVADADQTSLLEAFLTYGNLGDFWSANAEREQLHGALQSKVKELSALKTDLTNTKTQTETERAKLRTLQAQLGDQKKIVEANKAATTKLLAQTKNQEANYQKILAQRQAARVQAQADLTSFESQLKIAIDKNSYPQQGTGILAWPLAKPFITQYFGNTDFANAHAAVYNGKGHNGIDLRASIGTPILAALSGTITGTGNTDTVCPGASYGNWVLIKHANGLSTLYAHLSLIKVSKGQIVSTGDIIGYSGETGYATGPHLHFTVYASQGVEVTTLKSKVCSGSYTLPVATLTGYLNPLEYLPSL